MYVHKSTILSALFHLNYFFSPSSQIIKFYCISFSSSSMLFYYILGFDIEIINPSLTLESDISDI